MSTHPHTDPAAAPTGGHADHAGGRPGAGHGAAPHGTGVIVEGPLTTSGRMRAECWDLHMSAEAGGVARAMIQGSLSREHYVDLLGQTYAAARVLDARLREARGTVSALAALVDEEQMQGPYLERDLAFFGVEPGSIVARAGASHLIATADRLARENPLALLGLHYVREGANNGNRYVAKKLRQVYEMAGDDGFRHLDPYGNEQRARWERFKSALDAQPFAPAQQDELVAAGREMYAAIIGIHADVEAGAAA